jgi:hypothetical protein
LTRRCSSRSKLTRAPVDTKPALVDGGIVLPDTTRRTFRLDGARWSTPRPHVGTPPRPTHHVGGTATGERVYQRGKAHQRGKGTSLQGTRRRIARPEARPGTRAVPGRMSSNTQGGVPRNDDSAMDIQRGWSCVLRPRSLVPRAPPIATRTDAFAAVDPASIWNECHASLRARSVPKLCGNAASHRVTVHHA